VFSRLGGSGVGRYTERNPDRLTVRNDRRTVGIARTWPLAGVSGHYLASLRVVGHSRRSRWSAWVQHVGPAFPGAATVRPLPLSCRGQPPGGVLGFSVLRRVTVVRERRAGMVRCARWCLLCADGTGRGVPAGFAEPVVSLQMADGSEVHRPLRNVRARQVMAAVPCRASQGARGQSQFPGYYWSSTACARVIYESQLELARLLVADRPAPALGR
jgi:hypothetical protein